MSDRARLLAAGFAPRPQEATAYFRLVLELTGHGVHFVERGYSRGIAGETDDVWAVDRPMTVAPALMAPLVATDPSRLADAARGLTGETRFHPAYAATFEVNPDRFAATTDLDPPCRAVPVLECAHEVRCGRRQATAQDLPNQWSPLGMAVSNGRAAVVLALVRSAGLDPAAIAAESDGEAAARQGKRGIYPVHLDPLRELLRRALAEERRRATH